MAYTLSEEISTPMQMPNIRTSIRDEECNVTYHFMGYRELTRDEMIMGVRHYLSQPQHRRRKTPIRNKEITIITSIGSGL
jgi:hypothetical protein